MLSQFTLQRELTINLSTLVNVFKKLFLLERERKAKAQSFFFFLSFQMYLNEYECSLGFQKKSDSYWFGTT